MADPVARSRAAESVASRFTRIMNATTSRWGMLTDPPILALATGVFLIVLLASLRIEAAAGLVPIFGVLTALPFVLGVAISLSLLGARGRVIDWLAGLPFPVENLNAVLNGLGESLEVTFVASGPTSAELNALLDTVSGDAFVTKAPPAPDAAAAPDAEAISADHPIYEVRIGVVDSTRNPSASNHARYERVRALVSVALVPIHKAHPVLEVRVK